MSCFFLETLRNVTILLSTREQLVTQRRLNNNSRWINRAQHPSNIQSKAYLANHRQGVKGTGDLEWDCC